MKISYVERPEIDDVRWNKCISESVNGIVYAYSWYLDIVSPNWCALIDESYSYVFPLPSVKRYSIESLLQPLFTQQLGLFSGDHLTPDVLNSFLESIPEKYKYINIHLNSLNKYECSKHCFQRVTYLLDLISPYSKIQTGFNQNTRRNNLKAIAFGVSVTRNIALTTFIEFYRKNIAVKFSSAKFAQVEKLAELLIEKKLGEIVGAYSQGILCSAVLMVKSNGKLIYLFASSNHIGLRDRAMFAVVDQVIRWNAESHLVLDFEGSMIPSIARFYAGFGAKPSVYQNIKINQLPFYARFLLKIKTEIKKIRG